MRKQKFIMAIIIGIVAIFVAMNIKPKAAKPKIGPAGKKEVVKVKEIDVYVAKVDLKKGTRLNKTNIKKKKQFEDKVPMDAVTDAKGVEKKEVIELIKAGSLILSSKIKAADEINRLSNIIPKGFTAMTIRVDDISGVGGFIKQGDFVDVVGIFGKNKSLPFSEPVKTILVGVRVLTIGYEMNIGAPVTDDKKKKPPKKGEGPSNIVKAKKVPHVTIAVTTDEAEILTLVTDKARLRLLLRSTKDGEPTQEEKDKAMTKEVAAQVAGGKKKSRTGFKPPNRGGKTLGFSGNIPSEIANDEKFKSLFGGSSNQGLSKIRPTQMNNKKSSQVVKKQKQPATYTIEVRKGTQPPSIITVKD